MRRTFTDDVGGICAIVSHAVGQFEPLNERAVLLLYGAMAYENHT
jgi:hypothetical protein